MSFTAGGPYAIIGHFHQTGPNSGVCNKSSQICGVYSGDTGSIVFTFQNDFVGHFPSGATYNSTINAYQCSVSNVIPLETCNTQDGQLTAIIQY